MGFLSQTNDALKSGQSALFNSNPSQKSGQLGGITSDAKGILKTATGTVAGVGHTVAKVAGKLGFPGVKDFLEGKKETKYVKQPYENGLKAFYGRLGGRGESAAEGMVYHIDPINTFECYMDFFPSWNSLLKEDQVFGTDGESVIKDLIHYCFYADQKFKPPTIDQIDEYEESPIAGTEGDIFINLGIFIQKLSLPNLTTNGGETVNTLLGDFPLNGNYVKPEQNTFQMEIVNTRKPIGENIFYSWMREVTLPYWIYDTQPYTTADITIDLTDHCNIIYKFLNCRPIQIQSYQPSQDPSQSFTRLITFAFDYMCVKSIEQDDRAYEYAKEQTIISALTAIGKEKESTLDKIANIGNKVNFAASNILKI